MPFLIKIKRTLKKILPNSVFTHIHAFARYKIRPLIDREARIELKYLKKFTSQHGYTVIDGPFAGMQYIERASGSVLLLKLIGCYEKVLQPALWKIIDEKKINTIIDIGCAEGYYLVGLGRHLPNARLVGYDTEPDCLELTKEMLGKNNLQNETKLETTCTAESLNEDITGSTLLICDAEGFEKIILDPEQTPRLREVDTLIVETHDFIALGVTATLQARFAQSHTITTLQYDNSSYPAGDFLADIDNKDDVAVLINERGIPNQTVLVMHKK